MRKLELLFTLFATLIISINTASAQGADNGFNLIVVGDSQPQTKKQLAELKDVIIPQIKSIVEEYRATGYPTAVLITGDVVWDTLRFMPRVKEAFESLGVPIYTVIGNHDHNRFHRYNEERAERNYIKTFGPRNQRFMLGETLFVTFDNISYYRSYSEEVDSKQLVWLSELLEGFPSDQRVAVCMHASATDFATNTLKPYIKPLVSILGDREVHFVTGHRHNHDTADIGNITEHSVAQVNGNLWYAPICSDGMPRGVFCIEERNGVWQWQHRVLGEGKEKQIIAWERGFVKDNEEYVVVKIWGVDDRWSVRCSEDGATWHDMERFAIADPEYMRYVETKASYPEIIMERLRRSAIPARHYFRYRRTSTNNALTIKATDRFGETFEMVIP